jgi:hypothetical protein
MGVLDDKKTAAGLSWIDLEGHRAELSMAIFAETVFACADQMQLGGGRRGRSRLGHQIMQSCGGKSRRSHCLQKGTPENFHALMVPRREHAEKHKIPD